MKLTVNRVGAISQAEYEINSREDFTLFTYVHHYLENYPDIFIVDLIGADFSEDADSTTVEALSEALSGWKARCNR